jgi:hypothetical protein
MTKRRASPGTRQKSRVSDEKRRRAISGLFARSEFRRSCAKFRVSFESYGVASIPFAVYTAAAVDP